MLKNFNPLTWLLSGLLLCVGLLAIGFFMFYSPNMAEASSYIETTAAYNNEIAKRGAAQRRVKDAEAKLAALDEEWSGVVDAKTPPASLVKGGIDLSVNRWQLVKDARSFRNNIQLAVNAQVKKGGVRVITGPVVPNFSQSARDIVETGFNYPALNFPVVVYDFGTIVVEGTFDQIAENVESWSNLPNYMAVTDGLSLTGTSPVLRGTYRLSIVGFLRATKVAPPVPELASSDNQNSGPGSGPTGGTEGGAPAGGPPRASETPGRPGAQTTAAN